LQSSDVGETDDRDVYRIFGAPAGRFIVAATLWTAPQEDTARYTVNYPNTADESKARVIELVAGAEKQGVDIQLTPKVKTYIENQCAIPCERRCPCLRSQGGGEI
ncbi:MAG TPA: hypothetical protein VKG02_14825, partial [Blastocatellia bacterium]|nr:hypothetical protein [Blastocatellia bacterium]